MILRIHLFKINMFYHIDITLIVLLWWAEIVASVSPKNLVWNGGPVHLECEHAVDLWTRTGEYVKENVIAIKAVTYNNEIYVITPRMKHGVLATVWLVVSGVRGVELQPYPELHFHNIGECDAIQNAVDFYLDPLGHLWILDSGIVDTLASPRCTCPPKVVAISILLGKLTKRVDLSSPLEPSSLLQNVVTEYGLGGKAFVYISDASRGAIHVHEVSTGKSWSVVVCAPAAGLQMAFVKRKPAYAVLILVRVYQKGLLELDTATLRRKNSVAPLRVHGEDTKPFLILGSNAHHVYLRHADCSDVLSWDIRNRFDISRLDNIHSSGPRLTPTSVAVDALKHVIMVLDSNYGDAIGSGLPAYHRITFIGK